MIGDYQLEDTIFAPITAVGAVGAVCLVRVSGSKALEKVCVLFPKKNFSELIDRKTIFTRLYTSSGTILDEVLMTWFRAPNSYTGEDVIEIACHNSKYILDTLYRELGKIGLRPAYPGEFSKRAVIHGKMSLAQAEATADLIGSQTETQHRFALKQMKKGFSEKLNKLRNELLNFATLIELELDFAEEDVAFAQRSDLQKTVENTLQHITRLTDSFATGQAIKEGIPLVIVGHPNAGKSTLLNALADEDRALVSDVEGTTRDFIEVPLIIRGVLYRLTDTAGLRPTTQPLERQGIQKTWDKAAGATLILHLFDASKTSYRAFQQQITDLQKKLLPETEICSIANKTDLLTEKIPAWMRKETVCQISAKDDQNMDRITEMISQKTNTNTLPQSLILTNERHYRHLSRTRHHLETVSQGLENKLPPEFIAADLRSASQELGEITGEITHEDVLDNLFKNFCIGK